MKLASISLFSAAVFSIGAGPGVAAPEVVVSIKPIHSLVASIMKGVGEPKLIVDGAASPHTFSLKPSNAAAIEGADVIFWIGPGIEAFLEKPLDALAASATVIELEDAPGLQKLPFRESGAFEAHDDGHEAGEAPEHDDHQHGDHAKAGDDHADHDDDHHDHGGFDTHLWLDAMNAKAMAAEIEKTLVSADPVNAAAYQANGAMLMKDIDALDTEIKATVAPVKSKPFIVFHDAYQYFEHRYGVSVAGSITVSPETMPGAERVDQIQKKVKELGATCVFAEPQFEPKLVAVVTEGTPARSGTLDPEAATLKSGSGLYFELMRGLARSMKNCLSQGT
ncbi:zinc ABC transporter substrate-binding protein [Neorhizobium galegae]|uniref:zinc ABC transporter substrate-binding protein n=1 Tax=Neorhizobium galegae TaxID=399 RepID=UPI0006220E2B|nr:zinc ABC transporter substrate-binding protein [Neorhizobium galegae]KAB1125077.1 zinc ABC transporter substrate-binding protein [Neorhizobium galegae]MCQ1809943.1 zinc ABC transporter substrate-binding protein [Neorhizobium galegae]CDZ61331.1 High-affinity zinc uptake system protein ZnuA [Neorhizobium galegae bv. orientalis]